MPQLSLELVGWSKFTTATCSGTNWFGVVATVQGAWHLKTTSLPFPLLWARGLGFEPPDLQFFSTQIWILKAVVLLYLLTFQSNLLSVLFLPRNSTVNSFPFFLLPLPSYDKNHITPISHRIFPISLSYPKYTKVMGTPGNGYKTLARPIHQPSIRNIFSRC